jgi:hypothetical protein
LREVVLPERPVATFKLTATSRNPPEKVLHRRWYPSRDFPKLPALVWLGPSL